MNQWIIIYPRGDRKIISVIEICSGLEYEINSYALASRRNFYDRQEAIDYAVQLAIDNGLTTDINGMHNYLD